MFAVDIEERSVDVVVDGILAVERANVVDAQSKAISELLLEAEVDLERIRPAVVRIEGDELVEGKECRGLACVVER